MHLSALTSKGPAQFDVSPPNAQPHRLSNQPMQNAQCVFCSQQTTPSEAPPVPCPKEPVHYVTAFECGDYVF